MIVIFVTTKMLTKMFRSKTNQTARKLIVALILNLSLSDLLVSVSELHSQSKMYLLCCKFQIYTLAIIGKSFYVEGEYCLVDREWRSSAGCSLLGAILVVGSEESVTKRIINALKV